MALAVINVIFDSCYESARRGLDSCGSIRQGRTPPGGGNFQHNWVRVCGSLPKTLTLFMTKICDFPYPIYELSKNLIPYLGPLQLAQLP